MKVTAVKSCLVKLTKTVSDINIFGAVINVISQDSVLVSGMVSELQYI